MRLGGLVEPSGKVVPVGTQPVTSAAALRISRFFIRGGPLKDYFHPPRFFLSPVIVAGPVERDEGHHAGRWADLEGFADPECHGECTFL